MHTIWFTVITQAWGWLSHHDVSRVVKMEKIMGKGDWLQAQLLFQVSKVYEGPKPSLKVINLNMLGPLEITTILINSEWTYLEL